jgi:hypothetical protein
MRLIMRHSSGTVFQHTGNLWQRLRDWREWRWCWRNGYRFGIER